ncbi:MAG: hypothetical protein KY456_04620 [Chloroflexi bacterium]|nr:hypothetical protein [Chloroflexota bacterium]
MCRVHTAAGSARWLVSHHCGTPTENAALGLRPLTDERFYGVAVLAEATGRDTATNRQLVVTVYVFQEQVPTGPLGAGLTPTASASADP